jgi:hypothetical protein
MCVVYQLTALSGFFSYVAAHSPLARQLVFLLILTSHSLIVGVLNNISYIPMVFLIHQSNNLYSESLIAKKKLVR